MTFTTPVWIPVGIALLVLLWLALRAADARRQRDLASFVSGQLLTDLTGTASPLRRRIKRCLVLTAVGLCCLALAGPEIGFTWEETRRRGIDVMIAVDVSRSMMARDVAPSRLERAKLAVSDLLDRLGGDRVGLIAFAGRAFLQCPLTLDDAAFRRALDALEPGVIPAPGSDLASALDVAVQALASDKRNVKLLVLFSDGEDLSGDATLAAERGAKQGLRVLAVGVGTPAGELIPVTGEDGTTGFVKDAQGRIVKSRLDEETLRRVAEITGGFYVPLGQRGEGVTEVAERALAPIPKEELASRLHRVPRNRFQWPLAIALILLVSEPFIGERRRARGGNVPGVVVALLASGSWLCFAAPGAFASADSAQAEYERGEYTKALEEYETTVKEKDDPRLDFNLGAAAYRGDTFDRAAEAFATALRSEDPLLRQQSLYNLGNTQFRIGEKSVQTNPQETVTAWKQAIDAFKAALELDAKDGDAEFNRKLVEKRLEELERQMSQPKPSPDPSPQSSPQPSPSDSENDQEKEPEPNTSPDPAKKGDGSGDQKENEQRPDQGGAPSPAPSAKPEGHAPERSEPSPGSGQTEPSPAEPAEGQRAENPRPGQMSPEEARELLDSLAASDEMLPIPLVPDREQKSSPEDAKRDW